MAARLIFIKSSALLPNTKRGAEKELEGALIEYALCKETAGRLRDLYCGDAVLFVHPCRFWAERRMTTFTNRKKY